ncbi:metal transporter [Shewanella sp.]|uniref:metal transporter n=1 Tax=Shewanella sp. TaxID=50422 RepID=UPI003A9873D3
MTYLIASCIALLLGPLSYRYLNAGGGLHKGLDGFIFVSLGGLVLIHILPELLEHGGLLAILFVILGLWGPTASEKLFHRYSEITHKLTLIFGIAGLLLHTLTDGGAIVLAQQGGGSVLLALGVILHRLPVGLAIWWLLKPQAGKWWASLVIALMILLTIVGYFAGEQLLSHLTLDNTVYLQAFVTGSILHVVMHQPHAHEHSAPAKPRYELHAGIGSLLGIALLLVLLLTEAESAGHHHHHEHHALFEWLLSLAPALILVFVLATCRRVIGFYVERQKGWLRSWLQQTTPEIWVFAILLLGPTYGLLLPLFTAITAFIVPADDRAAAQNSLQSSLMKDVERCAPWMLLSLLLANLIGHPSIPLNTDWAQLILLAVIFALLPFSLPGAIVLAMGLGSSDWSPMAAVFCLLAPLLRQQYQQQLPWWKLATSVLLCACVLVAVHFWQPPTVQILHYPSWLEYSALTAMMLLFAIGLLRLGPREFLGRLKPELPASLTVVHVHAEHHEHHH